MTNEEERTSCTVVLLAPPDPEPGEPYFTIKSTGFAGSWKAGKTIRIPIPRKSQGKFKSMIIKIFKTIAVLTIMIPAVWMMVGMVLLAITAK